MIDFNDACRYQNHLRDLFTEVVLLLSDNDFITTTVNTHHMSDANKVMSDKVEVVSGPFDDLGITPEKVVDLALDIISERENLANAISIAKAQADLQIDAACMANKDKRTLVSYLNNMGKKQSRETEGNGTFYALNEVDGKQTPFIYKITTVEKINYDRNKVKGIANRLHREMKETSKEIDRYNLDIQVDFEPRWSEEDSIEDILTAS